MASSRLEEESLDSASSMGGVGPVRRIIRFGQKITGDDVPTVPAHYRSGPGSPSGRLAAVRLRPANAEGWLRLRVGALPRKRGVRTISLNASQPPAPTPDTLELRGGARVRCHDGYVGRLEGVALDVRDGLVMELLVRVRENVLADVQSSVSPLTALLGVSGQRVLLSAAWAVSTTRLPRALPFMPAGTVLLLNASAEQVASATVYRTDGQVAADVASRWADDPSLMAHMQQIEVSVHDGDVTLRGRLPSPRHRATAEQDAWHVLGVFAVHNRITVG